MERTDHAKVAAISLGKSMNTHEEWKDGGMELCVGSQISLQYNEVSSTCKLTDFSDDQSESKEGEEDDKDVFEEEETEKLLPPATPELLKDIAYKAYKKSYQDSTNSPVSINNEIGKVQANSSDGGFKFGVAPELLQDVLSKNNSGTDNNPDVCNFTKKAAIHPELKLIETRIAQLFEHQEENLFEDQQENDKSSEVTSIINEKQETTVPIDEPHACIINTNAISARAQSFRARYLINDRPSLTFQFVMMSVAFLFAVCYLLLLSGAREMQAESR